MAKRPKIAKNALDTTTIQKQPTRFMSQPSRKYVKPASALSKPSNVAQIWTSRTGNQLMLRMSIPVPGSISTVLTNLMTNAARYSQSREAALGGLTGATYRKILRSVKTTRVRVMAVAAQTPQPPLAITTNGILPSLDKTIADVTGAIVMAWQKFANDPQPPVEYVQFDDEIIVGQVPPTPGFPGSEEPGLVSENWVVGVVASLGTLGIAEAIGAEADVGAEVAANAIDWLGEKLGDMVHDLTNSPDDPNPPEEGGPTDMGANQDDDTPDGGDTGGDDPGEDTQDDGEDAGADDGDGDGGGGGGGGRFVPGEDGTLPVVMTE